MDFHGHINLQNNLIQQASIAAEADFPITPVVGRTVFKNGELYICVAYNNTLPIWLPLTNINNTYKHTQSVLATTWNINHNLNGDVLTVRVYDSNDNVIYPDSVDIIDTNNLNVLLNNADTGKVVIMRGGEIPANGVNILSPSMYSYEESFTNQSTIVVNHFLGYYPITRVFIGGEEVIPLNIIQDSTNQTTISFSTPQSGVIRMV